MIISPILTSPFGSIQVYANRLLGRIVTPEPPKLPKGPYLQRRYKRWRRKHPSYTVGDGSFYFVSGGAAVICHPDDLERLKIAVRERGLIR